MLKNACLLAKIGADTAKNERNFAEHLPKIGNYPTGPWDCAAYRPGVRDEAGALPPRRRALLQALGPRLRGALKAGWRRTPLRALLLSRIRWLVDPPKRSLFSTDSKFSTQQKKIKTTHSHLLKARRSYTTFLCWIFNGRRLDFL